MLATCSQHGQGGRQNRAPDAETQGIQALSPRDLLRDCYGFNSSVFNIVVPSFVRQGLIGVAPAHHKGAVALLNRITNQRVLGLQIKNVELVDARGDQQKRLLKHFSRERLVLNQLKQLVLKHHRAFGGSDVFTDFKQALIRHRHMALAHIMQQVLNAFGDALALGVQRLLLRIGVKGQKVAGGGRCIQLLHGKFDAGTGFGVGLHGVCHAHQGAGVQQIGRSRQCRHRVGSPRLCRKALVTRDGCTLKALRPQAERVFEILRL